MKEHILESWWFVLVSAIGIFSASVGFSIGTENYFIKATQITFLIVNSIMFFMILLNKILKLHYLDFTIYDLERRIEKSHERIRNTVSNNNRRCGDGFCEECD